MILINVDVNATHRDYQDVSERGEVLVYSSFYTFQGEGPFAGSPAFFIRLAGCNIGLKQDCRWCDTAFGLAGGKPWGLAQFQEKLELHRRVPLIVVTGGEPLLQWRTMREIIRACDQYPQVWQFETNGLLLRDDALDFIKAYNVAIVMSPKVPHSWESYRPLPWFFKRHDPALARKLSLKYVVEESDTSPYYDVPSEAHTAALAGFRVYVSGMTVYKRAPVPGEIPNVWDGTLIDRAATARNYKHAARLALAGGFHVSYQSHLFGAVE